MKKKMLVLGLTLFALPLTMHAEEKKDNWVNITGENNKLVAEVNVGKNNEVKYHADKEVAFNALFSGFQKYQQSCNEALAKKAEAEKPLVKPAEMKKKK